MRRVRRASGAMALPLGGGAQLHRRRQVRTRRRFGWAWMRHLPLLWLAALAFCAFLTYYVVGSGTFSVRTVRANGVLTSQETAEIEAQCGCIGANIFAVQVAMIERNLARIPTLQVTRVYTRLPNQVIVYAARKTRVAIWRTPEAAYAVDGTGEVLQVWRKDAYPRHGWKGVPVFDEGYDDLFVRGHRLTVGRYLPPGTPLGFALALYTGLPADLRAQVRKYVYRNPVGITVQVAGARWALFSPADDNLAPRIAALEQVVQPDAAVQLLRGYCFDLRGTLGKSQVFSPNSRCGD